MENVIVLAEWYGSAWGGSNIMVILLGAALTFIFGCYMLWLLTDKESFTFLLVLSVILAFLLWAPLNDCVQHRGETFQQIVAPSEVTQEQLLEKYDTVEISRSSSTPVDYNCWQVSFKQVD